MTKKNWAVVKRYHNGNREKNLQMIFSRRQAIQEERGLISRVNFRDNVSEQGVQIDDYRDRYGCFSHITYLIKTPLARKNAHNRTRPPRPAYDLSIRLRCERRKNNQQYRNRAEPKVQGSALKEKFQQKSYSVFITQQYMPPSWKNQD